MKGIVLLNAYTKSAGANRQASRIAEELNALGVQTEMRLNGAFDADIFSSRVRLAQKPDFVVYLDKDKYLSRLWEKEGVRLFNSADGVEVCDDKMLTYIALANGGVEIPDTLPAPLCYYPDARVREEYCRVVEERLGYPLVVKKSFGSWGMDVNLIQNFAELTKIAEEYKLFPHLYQKYIAAKRGEDTRVLVIGGKAVAAMAPPQRRRFPFQHRTRRARLSRRDHKVVPRNFRKGGATFVARLLRHRFVGGGGRQTDRLRSEFQCFFQRGGKGDGRQYSGCLRRAYRARNEKELNGKISRAARVRRGCKSGTRGIV